MAFQGCLVSLTADITGVNFTVGGQNPSWNSEIYDTDNAHDNVTNPTRITIPSAWNGKYGIALTTWSLAAFVAGVADGVLELQIQRNSSGSYNGAGAGSIRSVHAVGNGQSSSTAWIQAHTTPQLLASGDIYEAKCFAGNVNPGTIKAESSFGIFVHANPTVLMQCLAQLSGDKTGQNFTTPAAIAWDGNDVYDTHGIHSPTVNNSQLIIPAALNGKYVVVSGMVANINSAGGTGTAAAIRYNGSLTYPGLGARSDCFGSSPTNECRIGCQTPPLQVSTNDTFDLLYYQQTDVNFTMKAGRCSFGLRVVG